MAGKEIKELLINVKYKGIKPATDKLNDLSDALNDASDYAALLNEELSNIKPPQSLVSLTKRLERVSETLDNIEDTTRATRETLAAVLGQLGINADAARQDISALSDRVEDLGDTTLATGKEIASGFNKGTKASEGLSGSLKKTNNRLKDTNRQGTNTVRNFSSMASSAGGLASAYALVAANVFAVSEAFRLLNNAASVSRLQDVADTMSGQMGESINQMAIRIQTATDNTINLETALRQASAAAAYGFDTAQMEELTKVARRASVAFGVEMTDALNRVTRGISKQEIELLDELGITVRLTTAFQKYAAVHGLAADSLNDFQRQAALTNAVLEQSEQRLGNIDSQLQATEWERLGTNISQGANSALRWLSDADSWLTKIVGSFNAATDSVRKMNQALATTENLIGTFREARNQGSIGGQLQAVDAIERKIQDFRNQLVELRKEQEEQRKRGGLIGNINAGEIGQEIDIITRQLGTLTLELRRIKKEELFGGVEDADAAIDAYKNLGLVSKTAQADISALNAEIRGTGDLSDRMSSTLERMETALERVRDTDSASDRNELVKQLGFNSLSEFQTFIAVYQRYIGVLEQEKGLTAGREAILSNNSVTQNTQNLAIKIQELNTVKAQIASLEALEAKGGKVLEFSNKRLTLEREIEEIITSINLEEVKYANAKSRGNDFRLTSVQLAEKNLSISKQEYAALEEGNASLDARRSAALQVLTAQEAVRSSKESELLYTQSIAEQDQEHASRNMAAVAAEAQKLTLLEQQLQALKDSEVASAQNVRDAERAVALQKQQLQLTREDAARTAVSRGFGRLGDQQDINARLKESAQFYRDTGLEAQKVVQETLMLEQQRLAVMESSGLYRSQEINDQAYLVASMRQELLIAQKQQEQQMAANNLAGAQSIISELSPGLGQLSTSIYAASDAWKVMGDSAATAAQKSAAAAQVTASTLQGIGGVISAAGAAATSSIDAEIAAVQASGASQEEQEAKIKELNKKKIKEQEKYAKASILINTAAGVALALASSPPPVNFVMAGLTAAAGALAYQQASNSAASQLAGLASSSSSGGNMSLTLGEQNSRMSVNTADSATASERSQSLGDRGVYGRASKGNMHAGNAYVTGENGKELIVPKTDSIVTDLPQQTAGGTQISLAITALDSQSIEDRAPEILKKLEEAANQEGKTIFSA